MFLVTFYVFALFFSGNKSRYRQLELELTTEFNMYLRVSNNKLMHIYMKTSTAEDSEPYF